MKRDISRTKVLLLSAFLFVFASLIGFSILPSTDLANLYLPIINRLWPGEPGTRSPLLITEILYNPSWQEPEGEWIEIFNRGYDQLNLDHYKIGDSEEQGDMEGMFKFPSGAIIDPGQVIIIANNGAEFSEAFRFLPDFELSDSGETVPDMVKDDTWAGGNVNLSNSGDEILLVDQDNAIIDMVSWGKSTGIFMGEHEFKNGSGDTESFYFPVSDISGSLKKKGLYCPGSFVKINLREDHPLTLGMKDNCGIFFRGSAVFETWIPDFDTDRRVIGKFPKDKILLSGYCENEEVLGNKSVLVWLKKNRGQLVLMGFNPQFRASTGGTYKLLFNSILLGRVK